MRCFVGIDLGSTTTKAILMDENGEILGRGITNLRSNYDTATAVAKLEAVISTRLTLFRRALAKADMRPAVADTVMDGVERYFRLEQFLKQLDDLQRTGTGFVGGVRFAGREDAARETMGEVFRRLRDEAPGLFASGAGRTSDFFRDIAGRVSCG